MKATEARKAKPRTEKRISSILVDGTFRLTSVKIVNASITDSSRIPEDAIWHVFDFRTRSSSYVRFSGGVDELTGFFKILSKKASKSSSPLPSSSPPAAPHLESSSLPVRDDDERVEHEHLPGSFPLAHTMSVDADPIWRSLLAVCLSFEAETKALFASGLVDAGLGDEAVRWLLCGDDSALKRVCEERGALRRGMQQQQQIQSLADAVVAFASMARVPTIVVFLKVRKRRVKIEEAANSQRGSASVAHGAAHGVATRRRHLLILHCTGQPPDSIFEYDGREFRLVAQLSCPCCVKVGAAAWIEAAGGGARRGLEAILHCDVDRAEWRDALKKRAFFAAAAGGGDAAEIEETEETEETEKNEKASSFAFLETT